MNIVDSPGEVLPTEAVVTPASTDEVARLMVWAKKEGVGVLPVGAASGWSRSFVARSHAQGRCVLLSTARLAGVEAYEPADLTLTAGAGTPVRVIDHALRAEAQWIPFDPPFMQARTLGGLVASGASGPLWAGYGELRNHVLGMTVVTGDGRVLRLGGRVVKNVAGYDLIKAMVGSRGRLAVITSVCIRAFPVPTVDRVLALQGSSLRDLVAVGLRAVSAPVLPASTVLVDGLSGLGGQAALVLRLHGALATVDADQLTLERHLGARLVTLGDAASGRDMKVGGAASGDPNGIGAVLAGLQNRAADATACVVASALPSRMPRLVDALSDLGPSDLVIDCYSGSARAGAPGFSVDAVDRLRMTVEEMGGALRVERWPGDGSADPASTSPSADELDLAHALEKSFDPEGVLWPSRR